MGGRRVRGDELIPTSIKSALFSQADSCTKTQKSPIRDARPSSTQRASPPFSILGLFFSSSARRRAEASHLILPPTYCISIYPVSLARDAHDKMGSSCACAVALCDGSRSHERAHEPYGSAKWKSDAVAFCPAVIVSIDSSN